MIQSSLKFLIAEKLDQLLGTIKASILVVWYENGWLDINRVLICRRLFDQWLYSVSDQVRRMVQIIEVIDSGDLIPYEVFLSRVD